MKLADFPEVSQASPEEKIEFVNEILSSIGHPTLGEEFAGDDEVSDEVKSELDQRWAAYEKDPSRALSLDEVERRLKAKYG